MSSKAQKKSGYRLPAEITGHPLMCVTLKIPDEPHYQAAFYAALKTLGEWYSWEKTYEAGDTRATQAGLYWRHLLYDHLVFGSCPEEDMNGCMPVGSIILSVTVPPGWMECDGRHLLGTDYPDLFSALSGSPYAGLITVPESPYYLQNGIVLPDLRARVPIGNTSTDLFGEFYKPDMDAGLSSRDVGEKVGAETHTLTTAQIPAHNHPLPSNILRRFDNGTNPRTLPAVGTQVDYGVAHNSSNAGGGGSHNNMQPSLGLNYIMRVIPCGEGENLGGFRVRMHPEDPCQVQQSWDNGLTWHSGWTFPNCPEEDQDPGDTINNTYNYNTYMDDVKDDYDGSPGSVAPGMDTAGANRDAAICYALRILIYAVMDVAADHREKSEDQKIIFGALIGAAGLAFGLFSGGVGLLLAGAIASSFAFGVWQAIKATTEEELRDTAAREKVICCAYNVLAGNVPTEGLFAVAFDSCGFTAGTPEAKQAAIMAEMADDLEVYLAFLKAAQEGTVFAQNGLIEPCDQCADPCEFQNFKEGMGAWTLVFGNLTAAGIESIYTTNTAARATLTPGIEVTFTKLRARVFIPRKDDAQFFQIRVINSGVFTEVRRWDFQNIGWHTFEWNGASTGEAIEITATGTLVLADDCIIEWAEVCYI